MTFSISHNGLSAGKGSTSMTSNPAPAIRPERNPSINASSSKMPPREIAIICPPGLSNSSRWRSINPSVSGERRGDDKPVGYLEQFI